MPGSLISVNSSKNYRILLLLFGIALAIYIYLKKPSSSNDTPYVSTANQYNFTNVVFDILIALDFDSDFAKYATCQSALETANFTSNLFLNYNNAFGMKYAKQALSTGQINGFAVYKTVEDSCRDYIKWINYNRNTLIPKPWFINNLSDYVSFLKINNYFESDETEYLAGCQYYYDKYFSS